MNRRSPLRLYMPMLLRFAPSGRMRSGKVACQDHARSVLRQCRQSRRFLIAASFSFGSSFRALLETIVMPQLLSFLFGSMKRGRSSSDRTVLVEAPTTGQPTKYFHGVDQLLWLDRMVGSSSFHWAFQRVRRGCQRLVPARHFVALSRADCSSQSRT